jgi:diguanylate cyclase (GGDEF)-like protein/PAS domain S-box-containing protein
MRAVHRNRDARRRADAGSSAVDFGAVVLDIDHRGAVAAAHGQVSAFNAKPGELVGQPLIHLVHAEDRAALKSALALAAPGAPARHVDCRIRTTSTGGDPWRWTELTVTRDQLEGSDPASGTSRVVLNDATRARAAEQQLRESQALLQALLAHIPAAVSVRDPEGRLLTVNREFARVAGGHPEVLVGRVDAGLRAEPENLRRIIADGQTSQRDITVTLPSGEARTYSDIRFPVYGPDGRPSAIGEIATDVTELRSIELERAHLQEESEERYRLLAEHSLDVIARMRPNGTFSYVSPAATDVLGFDPAELTGPNPPGGRVHPEDEAVVADAISRVVVGGEPKTLSYRFLHGNGSWRWLETTWSAIPIPRRAGEDPGCAYELFAATRDVSERYAAQQQLEQLALRDGLTGLANRALLMDRLTTAIERLERRGGAVAVYLIDLDHFKVINDTFGHAGGDAVIVEAGRRLIRASRAGDTVARLGGDELILVAEVAGRAEAEALGARLLEQLRKPYPDPVGSVCTASVGLALARDYRCDPDGLLQRADVALYAAKQAGRDRIEVFAGAMQRRLGRRRAVEQQVRLALAGDGLTMHYQPLADLASGTVVGAEALARLDSTEGLPIAPDIFIGVAEETGLIAELDRWVITRVIQQIGELRSSGTGRCPVFSVNVSARTLASPEFASWLRATLDAAHLDGGGLSLELTERTLLVAGETVERTLSALADMGVGVGLDDFGTGWSSLRYLSELSLDFVKLDRSFTAELAPGGRKHDFAQAICGLARSLGLVVVAEGIETRRQVDLLRDAGCDLGQGYALARPAPVDLLPSHVSLV